MTCTHPSEPQQSKSGVHDSLGLMSVQSKDRRGWSIKDTASFQGLVQQFISLTNASEGKHYYTVGCLAVLSELFTVGVIGEHKIT